MSTQPHPQPTPTARTTQPRIQETHLSLILPARSLRQGKQLMKNWKPGAFPWGVPEETEVSGSGPSATTRWGTDSLHPEVRDRVHNPSLRYHLPLKHCGTHYLRGQHSDLRLLALEALWLNQPHATEADQDFLIIAHFSSATLTYSDYYDIRYRSNERTRLCTYIAEEIRHEAGEESGLFRLAVPKWGSPAGGIFAVLWIPHALSAGWLKHAHLTAQEMSTQHHNVAVGPDLMAWLQEEHATYRKGAPLPPSVLTAQGWTWTGTTSPRLGPALTEERLTEATHSTHRFSESWAVSITEHAAVYLPRKSDDRFLPDALLFMLSSHMSVYLLTILNRLRLRDLSRRLGELATRLQENNRNLWGDEQATPPHPTTHTDLREKQKHLIKESLLLDSEITMFLAGEWWTDVTTGEHADKIRVWIQQAGRLDESVEQLVQQSRYLRASIQSVQEWEENELRREEQRSSEHIERLVTILGAIGLPLTILLEIWVNWSSHSLMERGLGTWLCLILLLILSGGIADVLCRCLYTQGILALLTARGSDASQRTH